MSAIALPSRTYGPGSTHQWRWLTEEARRYEDALDHGANCSWESWLQGQATDSLSKVQLYYEMTLPDGENVGEQLLEEIKRYFIWPPCRPVGDEWEDYEARSNELANMPYAEYLQSPEWQETRRLVRRRFRDRCAVCNSPDYLQIHHRTYARRGEEDVEDLVALCSDCHSSFHESRKLVRE
jgi:5-methylcytosine-specific restriction endonuclease McrA